MSDKPEDLTERVMRFLMAMAAGKDIDPQTLPDLIRKTAQAFLEVDRMNGTGAQVETLPPPESRHAEKESSKKESSEPAASEQKTWKGLRDPGNPAVPIKKSVTPDYIVCLEDGNRMKMLKRHLSSHYGMTPEQYRAKWGLPEDYPMTAPNYALKRRNIARTIGFGGAFQPPSKRKAG